MKKKYEDMDPVNQLAYIILTSFQIIGVLVILYGLVMGVLWCWRAIF